MRHTSLDELKGKKTRLLRITLSISIALMVVKFIAATITNSNAILSDALESLVNIVAGGFALFSVHLAAKPKDKDHPYGHGKIEFLAAGLEGAFIFFAGLTIIGKAIYNIVFPNALTSLGLGIVLTVITGVVNLILGLVLQRKGREWQSITMEADGQHLATDAYTTAGLVIGLLAIVFTRISWLDGAIAILFALILLYSGYKLLRKAISAIMDETDEKLIENVVEVLNEQRNDNQIDFHNLRIIKYGSDIHIDAHLTLPYYWDLDRVHDELDAVDQEVNRRMRSQVELFIHPDPCVEISCQVCAKADCNVRKHPLVSRIDWNAENISQNRKHQIEEQLSR